MKKPKRKVSKEQELGHKAFMHELKARGVDGFARWTLGEQEKKQASKVRSADRAVDEQMKESVSRLNPKFGFSHIPKENWDAIFKEKAHARSN